MIGLKMIKLLSVFLGLSFGFVSGTTTEPSNLKLCGRVQRYDILGKFAPLGRYNWMAALGYTKRGVKGFTFNCAGSIINEKYVLTAAHCTQNPDGLEPSVVKLGVWDLDSNENCETTRIGRRCIAPPIIAGIEEVIIHPQFGKRGIVSDDIALIKLNITLDFDEGEYEPLCLPHSDVHTLNEHQKTFITGWDSQGTGRSTLLNVDVPVVKDELCKKKYHDHFVGKQLCIGGDDVFDSCLLGGSPLMAGGQHGSPFMQIGINSFGAFPCGKRGFPDVYTSVIAYRSWIINNLRP